MTQPMPLTDIEPPPIPDDPIPARLERLEFGKFCVSPEGPVERSRDNIRTEYSQLGWSVGFPGELISFCDPLRMGISEDDSDTALTDNLHGTVLRPVVIGMGAKLHRVFYRMRMRGEEGEDRGGRRYTVARYLVAESDDVDPLMLLSAMDSAPLQGITRKQTITPLNLRSAKLEASPLTEAFLREALIYVLSGIPLSITEYISESDFFSCVTALWRSLPPPLRPHLSAGWNVGASYSGKLAVTYAGHRAAETALFSPSGLAWSRPACVTTWDRNYRAVKSEFFEERLEPGRLYAQYVYGDEAPSLSVRPASLDRISNLISALPSLKLPELPDWCSALTIRAFRYPGLKTKDRLAISLLEQWLRNGKGEDEPLLCLDARQLTYQSTQRSALNLMIEALSYPATRRRRGDRALWLSLVGNHPDLFTTIIRGASGEGASRARLMEALTRRECAETLRSLALAAQSGEADNLPNEVVSSLAACLDDSIRLADKNNLHFHEHLLKSPPTAYRRWAESHALNLIGALAALPGAFGEETYLGIVEIKPLAQTRVFYEMIEGQEPLSTSRQALSELSNQERAIFLGQLSQDWGRYSDICTVRREPHNESVAERRENLLRWVEAFGPEGGQHPLLLRADPHPLLRLALGGALSERDVSLLINEIEQGYIPKSLLHRVSAFVLEHWGLIGRRVRNVTGQWRRLISLWPDRYAHALLGERGIPDKEAVSPFIRHAAGQIRLSFEQLSELMQERRLHTTFNGDAPLLWEWAMRLTPRPGMRPTAIDLCQYISGDALPNLAPENLRDEIRIFTRLAHESGMADRLVARSQNLWSIATQPWHLLLLLSLYPQVDFRPTVAQLGWLVPYRDFLIAHLTDERVHPLRREIFYLATVPFHSLSFRQNDDIWRNDFATHSIVWAAFAGVPAIMLPKDALRYAVRGYSGADLRTRTGAQSTELIETQSTLCFIFLRAYAERNSPSQNQSLLKVLAEFVLPLLSYNRGPEQVEEIFDSVEADLPNSTRKRVRPYTISRSLKELLLEIVMLSDRKMLSRAIGNFYKNR